ncbi:glycosyltransferase [Lacibacter sp.]|uniref:glycosyltransferase n=1 Tax=Lacibacter sp. TaxID=1915409 RepID=UPI002B4B5C82|nr:glycosyltransferase [Lacibacter sp.]HLP36100.1 glycosyltransferase [Lacibacter sp.]
MNRFSPLVSIVIPVYNGVNYLAEAIDSALSQTYSNIEIVVVNDGSTDDGKTREVALSYADKIRYFEKENGGVATALNYGIEQMKGDYFSWLSHDDLYYPAKVEQQVRFLETCNERDRTIVYSNFNFIDENGNYLRDFEIKHVEPDCFRTYFVMGDLVHGCTLLIPKTCFTESGVFNSSLRTTQDYDLWFRFAAKYRFVHIHDILVQSRLHDEQGTRKMNDAVMKEGNNLFSRFIQSLKWSEIHSCYEKPVPLFYLDFCSKNAVYVKASRKSFYQALLSFFYLRPKYIKEFLRKSYAVFHVLFLSKER